jgi:hypothetical protein
MVYLKGKPICLARSPPSLILQFEMDIICCPEVALERRKELKMILKFVLIFDGGAPGCCLSQVVWR